MKIEEAIETMRETLNFVEDNMPPELPSGVDPVFERRYVPIHMHPGDLEALRALVAAAEAGRWRPITEEDPAPHGVPVLLCSPPCITHPDGWEYEAGLASGGRRFQGGSTMWFHGTATHWRPLPPAPEA